MAGVNRSAYMPIGLLLSGLHVMLDAKTTNNNKDGKDFSKYWNSSSILYALALYLAE